MSQVNIAALCIIDCCCLFLIGCYLLAAKELQAQYCANDSIQVEGHTAYRVKENLNDQADEQYEARYEYIEFYLDELERLNPGTRTDHQHVDGTNEFLR